MKLTEHFIEYSDVVISKSESRSTTTTARSLDDEEDDYDDLADDDDETMDSDDKDTINLNEVLDIQSITIFFN